MNRVLFYSLFYKFYSFIVSNIYFKYIIPTLFRIFFLEQPDPVLILIKFPSIFMPVTDPCLNKI